MPSGKIQPEFVTRLNEIGEWLAKNGESIYATRGGPFRPRNWGAVTEKGNKLFIHVLDWEDEILALPVLGSIRSARLMATGAPIQVQQVNGATLVRLPRAQRDPIDTILIMERG
jgi:alpha-L-fucosidase